MLGDRGGGEVWKEGEGWSVVAVTHLRHGDACSPLHIPLPACATQTLFFLTASLASLGCLRALPSKRRRRACQVSRARKTSFQYYESITSGLYMYRCGCGARYSKHTIQSANLENSSL